jgi:predicted enzyme related to lactoylglutathione lyase
MKRVTGLGGIFFKSKDPKQTTEWYAKHLGLETNPYGAMFNWFEAHDNSKKGETQWAPFANTTKYFEPSAKEFMINYRVENLAALVETLKEEGITFLDEIVDEGYGKFIHLMDPEGNKIELWEPANESK